MQFEEWIKEIQRQREIIFALGPNWQRYLTGLETIHRLVKDEVESGERKPTETMKKALEIVGRSFEWA